MNHRPGAASSFRADIQGLRALAVLFVVLYHARVPGFEGGYVGVDIFFVISGFLITGLLLEELERDGRVDFIAFYGRRIRRLLPAAAVVLAATATVVWVFLSPLEQRSLVWPLLTSALYVSNLWFATQATDYLGAELDADPLLHTWSLAVEEQFYLVWPLLMMIVWRVGGSQGRRVRQAAALGVVFSVSLLASLWLTNVSQPWAFFGSPLRAWEFAAGALVCFAGPQLARLAVGWRELLGWGGLAAMAIAVAWFDDHTRFPGWAALLPVAGAAAVLAAGCGGMSRVGRGLGAAPLQTIGDLSYSWYLWHWPMLVLPAVLSGPMPLAGRIGFALASLAAARVTQQAVENRFRFSPFFARPATRSLALGAVLTSVGAGGAVLLHLSVRDTLGALPQAEYVRARQDLPRIYREGCHLPFDGVDIGECVYGVVDAAQTVVLLGDSHAAHWFPALESAALRNGWRLVSLTKSACPAAFVTPYLQNLSRDYDECAAWHRVVAERIARIRPQLVVVGNSSTHVGRGRHSIRPADWQAGMRRMLETMHAAGARVVVMRDTPRPGFDVPICLSRARWRGEGDESCNFARRFAIDERMFELDRQAAVGLQHVTVLDTTDQLCDATWCRASIGGDAAYRDNHHITPKVSARLAPVFGTLLDAFPAFR